MKNFTEQELDRIFSKGTPIEGCDPRVQCKDMCGTVIERRFYGRDDEWLGWEVDHIVPEKLLKDYGVPQDMIDNEINLQPLNWKNNVSKDDDYPTFRVAVEADDFQENNDVVGETFTVNDEIQEKLRNFYKDYIKL